MIEYRVYGTCETLEQVPPGAQVLAIDDQEVIAQCEGCGKYICDEDNFGACDSEETYLCKECSEVFLKEETEDES